MEGSPCWGGGAFLAPSIKPLFGTVARAQEKSDESADEKIFQALMKKAIAGNWERKPLGEVVAIVGLSFLGDPYIAHSLEAAGPERLIVNLRAFDCTTFYENSLVLARCVKLRLYQLYEFKQQLQLVRYRSGVLDGYASRLHYFIDWVADNVKKNILYDVTPDLGGVRLDKHINFMSTHVAAYPQLGDARNLAKIKAVENQINTREFYYIPKDQVGQMQHLIQPGDIIGITTSLEGLDASHTGIAIVDGGWTKFLHAPLSGGFVEKSPHSLAEYLAGHKQQTGIIIARPHDPTTE